MKSFSELTVADLVDEFEFLGSWEDRCDYLIDLGFELPSLADEEKAEHNRVHGCQSMVWMTIVPETGEDLQKRLTIRADSDAMLVRGLIALLLTVYDGKTPQEILETDIKGIFSELGLDRHLSPARKNGLAGMVGRIQEAARNYQATGMV